jgi:hypothetical protein
MTYTFEEDVAVLDEHFGGNNWKVERGSKHLAGYWATYKRSSPYTIWTLDELDSGSAEKAVAKAANVARAEIRSLVDTAAFEDKIAMLRTNAAIINTIKTPPTIMGESGNFITESPPRPGFLTGGSVVPAIPKRLPPGILQRLAARLDKTVNPVKDNEDND